MNSEFLDLPKREADALLIRPSGLIMVVVCGVGDDSDGVGGVVWVLVMVVW